MQNERKQGEHLSYVVELRDVLPTFLDAAGAEIPEDIDGASLLPLLQENSPNGESISTWNMPLVIGPIITGVL